MDVHVITLTLIIQDKGTVSERAQRACAVLYEHSAFI